MFHDLLLSWPMFWWGGVPLGLCLVVFVAQCRKWHRLVNTRQTDGSYLVFKLTSGNVHESINGALTVCSIVVPLLTGTLAYLALAAAPPRSLVPLLASTALFALSLVLGLFNLYALTTVAREELEISKEANGGFVPQFVAQLSLLAGGLAVLLVYFLWYFSLPRPAAVEPASPAAILVERPMLRPGMTAAAVRAAWGEPQTVKDAAGRAEWHYRAQDMEVTLFVVNDVVKTVTCQSRP